MIFLGSYFSRDDFYVGIIHGSMIPLGKYSCRNDPCRELFWVAWTLWGAYSEGINLLGSYCREEDLSDGIFRDGCRLDEGLSPSTSSL